MQDIAYNIYFDTQQSKCHKNNNFAEKTCKWPTTEFYAIIDKV